jgi:hypothetical protein
MPGINLKIECGLVVCCYWKRVFVDMGIIFLKRHAYIGNPPFRKGG